MMNYSKTLELHDTTEMVEEQRIEENGIKVDIQKMKTKLQEVIAINQEILEVNEEQKVNALIVLKENLTIAIEEEFSGVKVELDIEPYKFEMLINDKLVINYHNCEEAYVGGDISTEYIELAKGRKILDMYFDIYSRDNVEPTPMEMLTKNNIKWVYEVDVPAVKYKY